MEPNMETVKFDLNNTLTYHGVSYGPHKDKPTPVGLVLAILMLQGKTSAQAHYELKKLKGETEDFDFENIPHYENLVAHDPSIDSFDAIEEFGLDNLTEVDGIGKVGQREVKDFVIDAIGLKPEEPEQEEPEQEES